MLKKQTTSRLVSKMLVCFVWLTFHIWLTIWENELFCFPEAPQNQRVWRRGRLGSQTHPGSQNKHKMHHSLHKMHHLQHRMHTLKVSYYAQFTASVFSNSNNKLSSLSVVIPDMQFENNLCKTDKYSRYNMWHLVSIYPFFCLSISWLPHFSMTTYPGRGLKHVTKIQSLY